MAKMADEYRRDTRLVRTGLGRSQFQETSEAMFLNSGYVYDSAEEAAAFAGEADWFDYSRYGNPTVSMLQTRLAALERPRPALRPAPAWRGSSPRLPASSTRVTGWWLAARCSVPVMRS